MPLSAPLSGPDAPEKVNILAVDDLQEKLLVFKTLLEDLDQNLVFVRSGAEALREVLERDFAVILLDVNMPDIDGLETAAMIRRYRRSAHTPIIFITAYADEIQTTRGYSLGAVDYIMSPVVPEVLRSKVRVFVELHVLQLRIARQADARVAQAAAESALRVAEESSRRASYLAEISRSLSGLLDPHQGLHRLLEAVVPGLVPAATAVLLGEDGRPQRAACRRGAEAPVVDVDPDALRPPQRRALADLLEAPMPAQPRALALRDGDQWLGALLLDAAPTPLGEAVLGEVASRAATALAAARLHQSLREEIMERRRAEARLAESNRRKDEFLAMLSHELRNPLAPISNAVEVLRRIAGHDTQLRWATDITERQVRHLARLVDELLDVARIGQGKITLRTEPLDLTALLGQCVELQRSTLQRRGQTLTLALPAQPVWVEGDTTRLPQVMNNLLSNATKYTPDGGSVYVSAVLDGEGVQIVVRDDGMGIEAELLPRVFDLFEQGHRTLDRSQGGLGVGLTLVQRLVALHGGRVEAHSAGPGLGAEFRVFLPRLTRRAPTAWPEAGTEANARIPRRVLIVEDNADVAETTARLLALAGHTVHCARDGAQALACVSNFAPDVVLLDVGLPLMDGYEVARRLRLLQPALKLRLVALTGYGMPADLQRGRDAGFDLHVMKPVPPEALYRLVQGAATDLQDAVPAASPAAARG